MSLRARLAAVGVLAVAVETTLGVLVAITDGPPRIALYLVVCAVVTALVMAALWKVLGLPPRGSGGGGPGRGDDPPPPPWWPEFEREFRRHARERDVRAPGV